MTTRIDLLDPLILAVNQEEFTALVEIYAKIGGTVSDVGDGIYLIMVEDITVARFRIDRCQ